MPAFHIISGQKYNLRLGNNCYLSALSNGTYRLDPPTAGICEAFQFNSAGMNRWSLRTAHGKVVCFDIGKNCFDVRDWVREWERFEFIDAGDGAFNMYCPDLRIYFNFNHNSAQHSPHRDLAGKIWIEPAREESREVRADSRQGNSTHSTNPTNTPLTINDPHHAQIAASFMAQSNCEGAAVLLAKYKGFPLDAFHEALTDQSIENSHEVAMCVALHRSCGVNLRACLNAYAAELPKWGIFKAEPGSDPRLVPGTMDLQPTPLSLAIRARRYDVMRSLLAVGVEAKAINYIANDKRVISMGGQPVLVTYDRSWSPIFIAAGNGASGADIVLLIARGADPNIGDGNRTPLRQAIRTKNISALEALVHAKGIDLNATGSRPARGMCPSEWTPLREAVDCKSFTAVKMLLDRGASTESRDNHRGYSPLLAAVYNGDIETVKYLIARGANVRAQQWENGQPGGCCVMLPDGTSVLYVAAEKSLSELIPLLLAKGADKDGQTLSFAAHRGNVTAVNVLLSHGMGVTNVALNAAVSGNNLNCIMALCDHGADLSKVDFRHIDTANQRNAAVVAFLAAEGVTPDNAVPDDTCRIRHRFGWY